MTPTKVLNAYDIQFVHVTRTGDTLYIDTFGGSGSVLDNGVFEPIGDLPGTFSLTYLDPADASLAHERLSAWYTDDDRIQIEIFDNDAIVLTNQRTGDKESVHP